MECGNNRRGGIAGRIAAGGGVMGIRVKERKRGMGKHLSALVLCTVLSFSCLSSAAAHEDAVKIRSAPSDRTETGQDDLFRRGMHMTYLTNESSPYGTGEVLYRTLTLTGDALGETQIYSVRDIEELASLSLRNQATNRLGLTAHGTYSLPAGDGTVKVSLQGLPLVRFLQLCGLPEEGAFVRVYGGEDWDTPALTLTWHEVVSGDAAAPALLAFGEYGGNPLLPDETGSGGPLCLVLGQRDGRALYVDNVTRIELGTSAQSEPPYYGHHNRAPFTDSLDKTFTVNLYDRTGAVGGKPLKSAVFTTAQLEIMAREHPEQVRRGYFGTLGNQTSMQSMGLGAWLDYFEGIDLLWLLTEQAGMPLISGRAVFYGRDGLPYTEVEDLRYLTDPAVHSYTIMTQEEVEIPGAVPMLAFSKNGYPLLPEHDHDSSGYHDYNRLNQNLMAAGVATEVGVIKNHNGPFVACLGNVDGFYGGYRKETGGDCVRIDIYLDLTADYCDVAEHWGAEAIAFGLVQGYFRGVSHTTFAPDAPLTRGMLVSLLHRMSGGEAVDVPVIFSDVSPDSWYAPAVAWAVEQGVASGVGGGSFAPDRAVTREELAVMLEKLIPENSGESHSGGPFADEAHIPLWAQPSVSAVRDSGLMTGDGENRFCPGRPATRAQAAVVLRRLSELRQTGT